MGEWGLTGQVAPGPPGLDPGAELDRAVSRNTPAKNRNAKKMNITNPPQTKT